MQHSQIDQSLGRFDALYPRLVKQKVKESGIGGRLSNIMQATNKASKNTQTEILAKCLSTEQRLQLINTLAKSESIDSSAFELLTVQVDSLCHSQKIQYTDKDHYLFCLFIQSAINHGKHSDVTTVLANLMIRAQAYLSAKLVQIQANEEASELEVSLTDDADLQAQMDFILFVLRKGIVKHDLSTGADQIQQIFEIATQQLTKFITMQQDQAYVQLIQFAPYAIWFDVLYDIFWAIKQSSKHPKDLFSKGTSLKDLLKVTFDVLLIYKKNSQYYMVTIGSVMSKQNNSQTGEQTTTQPAVRRMSKLFSEILNLLITFMSAYLTSVPQEETQDSIKIYEMLIKDKDGSSFTPLERLNMLSELNFLFQKIDVIQNDDTYWQTIREGLYNIDQSCRKAALNILKYNLQNYKGTSDLEYLWTTFFDIYDTLESFGSHLTKAVWHRTELFYEFIKKFDHLYVSNNKIDPLQDMRMWLLVIYHRVASHNNIKVRRFVQKATLKREYITTHMKEFFFNEFIAWLNQCLIFKDVNNFTQFSKNALTVLNFYANYFKNESVDLFSDLKLFFMGFTKNKSHSQMTLICLKTLSSYPGDLKWITEKEVLILLEMLDVAFHDQVLSGKYSCFKYICRMLANHLADLQDFTIFFKLMGHMPMEFFSKHTVFDDFEARQSIQQITANPKLKGVLQSYLQQLFTLKAMSLQMPKFGKDTDLVLKGICKLVMTYTSFDLGDAVSVFDTFLESTYLQPKLVEQKISYFVKFCYLMITQGSPEMQQFAASLFIPRAGLLLQRFWDELFVPLARDDDLLVSEFDKIESAMQHLKAYSEAASLAVLVIHIQQGQQNNALESFIKNVLTKAVQLSSQQYQPQNAWSAYLLQIAVLQILQAILKAYSEGIKLFQKTGQSQIFIQDDLFVIGKVLLQNLMTYRVNVKVNGSKPQTDEQGRFMAELEVNPSKINQKNSLNSWQILAFLLTIFQFDPEMRQLLVDVYNKQVTQKTLDFLDAVTPAYNPHLFYILKTTFVPSVIIGLRQDYSIIEDYQHVIRQCWTIVKQQKSEVQADELTEFLGLAFNQSILELYQTLPEQQFQMTSKFHQELAKEMLDYGNKYWLILRSFFNHLMFMFAQKPYLMRGLEQFVINFGTTRECRSLDAEIKLYKLQVMIPEVFPSKFENLAMEEITYQGAYIRTTTLILMEGIVANYIASVKQESNSLKVKWTGEALTNILLKLLHLNLDKKQMAKSDQPFSEPHRIKLRTWQMLMLVQPIINDAGVHPNAQTLEDINNTIWPILKQNHLQNIRQYMECFTIKFVMRYPQLTLNENSKFYETCLETQAAKPQLSASLLLVAGYVLLNTDPAKCLVFKRKIFDKLVGYTGSNSAHCRSIAQYFIIKLSENEPGLIGSALQPMMKYLHEAKDVQKMKSKYEDMLNRILYKCLNLEGAAQVLSYEVTVEGEYVGDNFIDNLMQLTTDIMCEFRAMDEIPFDRKDWWKNDLEERKAKSDFSVSVQALSDNYQRKILPWEHIEIDMSSSKRVVRRRRNEIILCAALIDKIPNLAGLARTCEIMNASSLIVDNAAVCQTEEFKGISVTSEKWLPIYEVKERDLLDYLLYQKSNGYKIVGIEQTANSKMLHEFKFPTRCVLLLGKEKEGIPQEYYSVLDFCVEIPQFGIIRSLNVHVSGALCLWEYTKQHMPTPAPRTDTN